ncbi:MAG: glycosyltransferase [Proteobacteria bacterium]|nr:MAG: glycosyltransferase [Pseudomonadota bacterium]MBC6945917.1 glycosyltransferase [Gammaproteobacteria bacterium]MCE7895839.1 glycosyltransferase [Gammaproteobacteria bacterium PRO8]MDL1881759.1 glycosyltransferase [Gammaproteobacteria bacterium PRO2]MCL4776382.1 glycosyltransferase [Gammaproteobacteria bacterium]
MHHAPMRSVRVLHAIHSLRGGGAEAQLRLLCTAWSDPAVEMAVLCVQPDDVVLPERVRVIGLNNRQPLSVAYLTEIVRTIRAVDPDVVHVWLPASVSIPVMVSARLLGKAVVFSYRSKMTFHRPLCVPEFAAALACAQRIVSNSPMEGSNAAFRWLFRLKNGAVIPNGTASVPGGRNEADSRSDRKWRFIFVGRLTRLKNCDVLLHAFDMLAGRSDWHLDLFGVGEEEGRLRKFVERRNLQDRVVFRGYERNIQARMRESDCLVLPSLSEGMPNVLIEAMAVGLPVVASDVPGIRWVVGNESAVVWVDPSRPGHIAEHLAAIMDGRVDTKLMVGAGYRIAGRYSPGVMVDRYRDFYRSLASGTVD